jgi:hypothetical protein
MLSIQQVKQLLSHPGISDEEATNEKECLRCGKTDLIVWKSLGNGKKR